jgi:hypothetical protein
VTLLLAGNVATCSVSDNGSASELAVRGRGLTIVGELAGSLGGRVHASCAAEGSSFLLTFPLTESEQRAASAAPAQPTGRSERAEAGDVSAAGSETLTMRPKPRFIGRNHSRTRNDSRPIEGKPAGP